jgi:predicted metal-binding membrane protein
VEHWRGGSATSDALRLGWRHGLFCLGCCWTLMLLMFAIGGANLGWMLTLGAIMATERTTWWGRHLTRPLGIALVALAVLQVSGVVAFPAG